LIQTDKGRLTKGTAETMLAEVYMTQKKFDLGHTAVIACNYFVGSLQFECDYADNFDINKENGPESIFEIQYIEGPNGLGSDFVDTFIPWDYYDSDITGYEIANGAQNGWNIPTQDLVTPTKMAMKEEMPHLLILHLMNMVSICLL
jgi:hypothetical protein